MPAATEYKQLRSGNRYHPFDVPQLTNNQSSYRKNTSSHLRIRDNVRFGYPKRRAQLGLNQQTQRQRLSTKFPPFVKKPTVANKPLPVDLQIVVRDLSHVQPETRYDERGLPYKYFDYRKI